MTYLVDFTYYTPNLVYYLSVLNVNNIFLSSLSNTTHKKEEINIVKGEIEFKNVCYNIASQNIFDNISLKINSGEKIAIVGKSGSGKSTFIKLLMKYFKTTSGNIIIDGQDLENITTSSLRANISYVTQNTKLFNTTIYENIVYGFSKNKYTKEDINRIITDFKIESIFELLPKKLDYVVGINGDKLSGGQKQAIHLIRCFLKQNKIMILDEPTSAIDVYNKREIIDIIYKISKDKTFLNYASRIKEWKYPQLKFSENTDYFLIFGDNSLEKYHGSLVPKKKNIKIIYIKNSDHEVIRKLKRSRQMYKLINKFLG